MVGTPQPLKLLSVVVAVTAVVVAIIVSIIVSIVVIVGAIVRWASKSRNKSPKTKEVVSSPAK